MLLIGQACQHGLQLHSGCVHDAGLDTAVAAAERKLTAVQTSMPAEAVPDAVEHADEAAVQLKAATRSVCLEAGTVMDVMHWAKQLAGGSAVDMLVEAAGVGRA